MARNAAEIADSDGESDADVASSASLAQSQCSPRQHQGQAVPDIDLGVNFSDFLSQSHEDEVNAVQHSEPQMELLEGDEASTGTTASLRRQIESEQRKLAEQKSSENARLLKVRFRPESHSSDSPLVAKTKRSHSELLSGGQMDGGGDPTRKRRKTYNSSSSSRLRSSQSERFAEEHQNQDEGNATDQVLRKALEGSLDASAEEDRLTDHRADFFAESVQHQFKACSNPIHGQSALHDQGVIHPQQPQQLGTSVSPDAFKDYMQMSSGHISTSRSLMGNHESINLHFSGSGPGLDVNANPFGNASQGSVEDGNGLTDQERLRAIFRPSVSPAGNTSAMPFPRSLDGPPSNSFVPKHSDMDEATYSQQPSSLRLASARSKSCVDPSVLTKNSSRDIQGNPASVASSSRKRRKTVDDFALDAPASFLDENYLQSTAAPTDLPPPKVETQFKKRGRKPKNQAIESRDALQSEHSANNDDNEKCGSGNEGLTEKNSSSELHLDDESAIGLPQEQYKPRPSRSRSKRTAEDEMPPPAHTPIKPVQPPLKQPQTPDAMNTDQLDKPEEDTPLTKLRKEKKRKNKLKRAKTSAAALLKKSDKMHSDGEEDVVWVDSKPATVKMKLPDPVEVKREDTGRHEQKIAIEGKRKPADTHDGAAKEQPTEDVPEKAAEVSVDIPEGGEGPQKQPPKKRGRKKTAVEKPVPTENEDSLTETSNAALEARDDAVETEDLSHESKLRASSRQALKETDANTPHSSAPQAIEQTVSTPQKGNTLQETVSHTKDSHEFSPTTEPLEKQQQQQQQQPPTPQPKPTTNDSTDKGPTKHSPINPTGGKVKYRVGLSKRAAIPPLLKMVRK
jgi:hypothetical protein